MQNESNGVVRLDCPNLSLVYRPWTNKTTLIHGRNLEVYPETFLAMYKEVRCGRGNFTNSLAVWRDYSKRTCSSFDYGIDVFRINKTHIRCSMQRQPAACPPVAEIMFRGRNCILPFCSQDDSRLFLDSPIMDTKQVSEDNSVKIWRIKSASCIAILRNLRIIKHRYTSAISYEPNTIPQLSYLALSSGEASVQCRCYENSCLEFSIQTQRVDALTGKLQEHSYELYGAVYDRGAIRIYGGSDRFFAVSMKKRNQMTINITKEYFENITENGKIGLAMLGFCSSTLMPRRHYPISKTITKSLIMDLSPLLVKTYIIADQLHEPVLRKSPNLPVHQLDSDEKPFKVTLFHVVIFACVAMTVSVVMLFCVMICKKRMWKPTPRYYFPRREEERIFVSQIPPESDI